MATRTKVTERRKSAAASTQGKAVAPREQKEPDLSTYTGRVAARIRMAREEAKMDRPQFQAALEAAGAKFSLPAIYAYENGQRALSPDYYPVFAQVLGFKSVRAFLPAN